MGELGKRLRRVQNVLTLEVALVCDAKVPLKDGGVLGSQYPLHLVRRPDKEYTLLALAVGVLGRVEASLRMGHLPQHVVQGLLGNVSVKGIAGSLVRVKVQPTEKGVVVQHLLKVGHQPEWIRGVAMKPSSKLVVDASPGHALQSDIHHAQRLRLLAEEMVSEEELQDHRLGELGRRSESPVLCIELVPEAVVGGGEHVPGQWFHALSRAGRPLHSGCYLFSRPCDVGASVPVRLGERHEDSGEAGHPVAVLRREVGSAVEGLACGCQEHRHGPSAASGHGLHCAHVDGVQVRPLLPVHLYVYEVLVHYEGDLVVLEGLPLHNVAPVARRVADAEEYGLVLLAGLLQGLLSPGIPVHRVVGVLHQVGACLVDIVCWACSLSLS